MKKNKVLIITHSFPPLNKIGAIRLYSLAYYLNKLGHDVSVITTKKRSIHGDSSLDLPLRGVRVIETPFLPNWLMRRLKNQKDSKEGGSEKKNKFAMNIKQILRKIRQKYLGSIIDLHQLWPHYSFKQIKKDINLKEIEIMISSYAPSAPHQLAKKIKKQNPTICWVADYRDLWSMDHIRKPFKIIKYIESYQERNINSKADVLMTVSKTLKEKLQNKYKKETLLMENGYLLTDQVQRNIPPKKISNQIRIVYTGQIYPGKRDPGPLLKTLKNMIDNKEISADQIRVDFYGYNVKILKKDVEKYRVSEIVNLNTQLAYKESLQVQKSADLLLFLESGELDAKGVVTGKLFEYMVAGVPILALGIREDSDAAKIIKDTGIGELVGNNEAMIRTILLSIINKTYEFKPNEEEISYFNRENLVKKFHNDIRHFREISRC